jgi:hypothetical protein
MPLAGFSTLDSTSENSGSGLSGIRNALPGVERKATCPKSVQGMSWSGLVGGRSMTAWPRNAERLCDPAFPFNSMLCRSKCSHRQRKTDWKAGGNSFDGDSGQVVRRSKGTSKRFCHDENRDKWRGQSKFAFDELPPGTYTLMANPPGAPKPSKSSSR